MADEVEREVALFEQGGAIAQLESVPQKATGREWVKPEDFQLGWFTLLQGSSEPVKQGIEGASVGKFYHTTQKKTYSKDIEVLIIGHTKSRSLFPNPGRDSEAVERCFSVDLKSGSVYGSCDGCKYNHVDFNSQLPRCNVCYNFPLFAVEDLHAAKSLDDLPLLFAVLSLKRTGIKGAKALVTRTGGGHWFKKVYRIVTDIDKNEEGQSYVVIKDFNPVREATNEEQKLAYYVQKHIISRSDVAADVASAVATEKTDNAEGESVPF